MSQYKPALVPLALLLLDTRYITSIIRQNACRFVQSFSRTQITIIHVTWYPLGSALYLYQGPIAHQKCK